MNLNLKLSGILFTLLIAGIILFILKKGRISIKYAIVWLFASIILFLFILFPELLTLFSKFLGFQIGANMIFAGLIVLLVFINIILTVIVSGQNQKIRLLIQEVSIMKSKGVVNYEKNDKKRN